MAVSIFNKKTGQLVKTLLNPAEKAKKYALEMKDGIKYTNNQDIKYKENSNDPITLSKKDYAYRAGYLQARIDSSKAFNHNKKKFN